MSWAVGESFRKGGTYVSVCVCMWAQEQVRVQVSRCVCGVCVCVRAQALMKPISMASLMAAYTVTGRQRGISPIY